MTMHGPASNAGNSSDHPNRPIDADYAVALVESAKRIDRLANAFSGGNHHLKQDLLQEGRLGLYFAQCRYTAKAGVTLWGYAYQHVAGRMKNHLQREFGKIRDFQFMPLSDGEFELEEGDYEAVSLEDTRCLEILRTKVELAVARKHIKNLVAALSNRQRQVWYRLTVLGYTQRDVAKELQISAPLVCRLKKEAEARINAGIEEQQEFRQGAETEEAAMGQRSLRNSKRPFSKRQLQFEAENAESNNTNRSQVRA